MGSLILTNPNNSYSGATDIVSGRINLKNNSSVLPDGTELIIRNAGALALYGGISQTVGKLVGTSTNARISLNHNFDTTLGILTVNQSTNTEFEGVIFNLFIIGV